MKFLRVFGYTVPMLKILFVVSILAVYCSMLFSNPEKNNLGVISTSVVLAVYSIYRSFVHVRYSYSIYQFFYIFSLLFMVMAPLLQYKQSIQTVDGYDIADSSYVMANIIIIFTFVIIDIIYNFRNKKINNPTAGIERSLTNFVVPIDNYKLKLLLLAMSLVSLFYVLFINQHDLVGVFYRDVSIERVDISNMLMIVSGIIRPLSIFAFIYYYLIGKSGPFKIILFIIAVISCFPLSLTRFLIGAYWIPVAVVVFRSLNKSNLLGYLYAFGLLILFPIFEVFRALTIYLERGTIVDAFSEKISDAFASMAYDSYQSLAFVIQEGFITYGHQLLGVFGLFIPRSLWEGKPIGSGFTMSDKFNLGWDNISMNFFGEAYINFGFIGILIFTIFLASAMRYLDGRYWKYSKSLLFMVVYLIILGIFAYIMRGDLIGSVTSTVAAIISASMVYSTILLARKFQG